MIKQNAHRHVLIDAGPLVAIFRREDEHHHECVETLQSIVQPLLTTWFVIAEASHLLRDSIVGVENLLAGPTTGLYRILPLTEDDLPPIAGMVRKYQKLGPQVADISLIHVAQRNGLETVFTLDRRDFTVYRTANGRALQLLPEVLQRRR